MPTLTSSLFSLDGLAHSSLLQASEKPWQILDHLKAYIESYSHLGQILSPIPSSVTLINKDKIFIDEGVSIGANATIEGPVIIGRGCEIRSNAFVRAYCLLEEGALIGHCSEVKASIFLPHAKAPHFNYVGDSIIGRHVNLGAGVTCANLRLDHKKVAITTSDGTKIETQRDKLGALIGDDSQIGCQTVMNPGIILKRKTLIRPLTSVSRSNINHFL